MELGPSGYSMLAAPEDGRTPPTSPLPSLTHYATWSFLLAGQRFGMNACASDASEDAAIEAWQ